jgi:general secretion pathway protein G
MCCTDLLDNLVNILIMGQLRKPDKALTLLELLLVVALVGTLGTIGVPTYNNYIDKARNVAAMADIRSMESKIVMFQTEHGRPPNTLAEAAVPTRLDPWGNPYEYLRIQGIAKKDINGKWRKDHFLVPINSDFDLYSMGKDEDSKPPLTAKASRDDIVRANNGVFVGLASEY